MKRRAILLVVGVFGLLLTLPLWASPYTVSLATLFLFFAYAGQAWNIMMGFAGLLSLGHALYLGVGAYTVAALYDHFRIGPWVGLWVALALCGLLAAAIAALAFRYRVAGVYFALLTIACAEFARIGFDHFTWVGGSGGLFLKVVEPGRMTANEIKKSNQRWQSDVIVDLIKQYEFPYIALNPGASYRGLHDSLVNYGENQPPMQINRLLGDLLDSSRITQGKLSLQKEHTNLVTAINRAIEATRSIVAQAGHRVVVDFPSEPLTVQADLMRLTQVFSNLLNNAAKFTDSEGDIRVTAERQGNQAVVGVKDSGIGIAPELMPKIFDMFVQGETVTERTHGGLGLGLTLARDIVQLHGGSIEAKSDGLGKGSEFVVALPLSVPPQPLEYGRSATAQIAAATVPRRIVIVDDSKNQVLSLERLFKRMGHEVRVAYDAAGAVRVMEEFLPDFALIDIGLPGVNGYDLARQLRDRPQFRSVTLIAQTGWGREEDRNEARDAGFDHHLVKPIDHQRLAEILANPSSPRPS